MSAIVRRAAPDFEQTAVMPDGSFKTLKLGDYAGKWLVLASYPLDFTFVCPTEITSFSDRAGEFTAINTEVVMWSVDSKFSHLAWTQQPRNKGGLGRMAIPLIADITKQMSKDYGVLINNEKDGDNGVTLRAVFVIDPKGVLRHVTMNDLPVGRNVDEVLRVVQGFQYHEKTGDVVPCAWTPGKKTMTADPVKSQEYFKTLSE